MFVWTKNIDEWERFFKDRKKMVTDLIACVHNNLLTVTVLVSNKWILGRMQLIIIQILTTHPLAIRWEDNGNYLNGTHSAKCDAKMNEKTKIGDADEKDRMRER